MDNITELLHQTMNLIIFCIAVTLLFLGYQNYCNLIKIAGNEQYETVIYEGEYGEPEINVSRGELIASLCNDLVYDIEINDFFINSYEHDKSNIESYPIHNKEYRKSYRYDNNGYITRIVYIGIS